MHLCTSESCSLSPHDDRYSRRTRPTREEIMNKTQMYTSAYAQHGKLTLWRNPGETFTERIQHFGKFFCYGSFLAFLLTTIPPTRAASIITYEQTVRFPVRTLVRNCVGMGCLLSFLCEIELLNPSDHYESTMVQERIGSTAQLPQPWNTQREGAQSGR